MSNDSKFICSNLTNKGVIVCNKQTKPNLFCIAMNRSINNIVCGKCNHFDHIPQTPEKEIQSVVESVMFEPVLFVK